MHWGPRLLPGAGLLQWEETGGPEIVNPPQVRGCGSILAERSITGQLDGTNAFDWRTAGVKLTITIPLERLGV
jgi:hypothetical protein